MNLYFTKKRSLVLILYLLFSNNCFSEDFHIATTGNNSSNGSLTTPFATIQHTANSMKSGDTAYVHAGRYHEKINLKQSKNSSELPITFKAYNNETVILDGSVPVEDLATGTWTQYKNDIYQIQLNSDISQVFINDEWSVLARWPNVPNNKDALWDRTHWAKGDREKSTDTHEFDTGKLAESGLNITGSTAILNVANFTTSARLVTEHEAGESDFKYKNNLQRFTKENSHYYFLDSKLTLLDSENEWYFDPESKILYLWQPGGGIPEENTVRTKNIDYVLNISESQHINLIGIDFFSSTFDIRNSSHITIEDSDLKYPVYNRRTLGHRGTINGSYIYKSNHISILNCHFSYTDGIALFISRSNNSRVENSEFHHLDYSVAHFGSVNSGSIWFQASPNATFKRNTIYKTGASEGLIADTNGIVELNKFYDMAHLQGDGAYVHLFQGSLNVDIVKNWFYQTRKPAIRLSDGPKDYLPAPPLLRSGRAISNVIFDQSLESVGFVVKGDEREIYNNTLVRDGKNLTGISLVDDSYDNSSLIHANSSAKNNAVSSYISKNYKRFSQPNGDISHNWEGRTDIDGFNKSVITSVLRDANNWDFRPKPNSELVDSGVIINGISFINSPDIGAYEFGDKNYWIPGRKITKASVPIPKDKGQFVSTEVDLMWLNAYKANSHDVYIGTSPDKLILAKNISDTNIVTITDLTANANYYWRVDANTSQGVIPGDLWEFSTDKVTSKIFKTIADSYVDKSRPEQNFGNESKIELITSETRGVRWGYLKFNVDTETAIRSAKLRIYNNGGSPTSNIEVFGVENNSWKEQLLTWENKPALLEEILGRVSVSNGAWKELDVSSLVSGNGEISFGLKRSPDSARRHIASKEASEDFAAQLIITHNTSTWNQSINEPTVIPTETLPETTPDTNKNENENSSPEGVASSSGGGNTSILFIIILWGFVRKIKF